MNLMEILTLTNTIMIVVILAIKFIESRENREDYIREVIEVSLDNSKQEFEEFFEAVKVGYTKNQTQIIKKMQETEEELEKLKERIKDVEITLEETFKKEIETQEKINKNLENRIINAQSYISMLEKKLSQSKKKIERLKNEKNEIER